MLCTASEEEEYSRTIEKRFGLKISRKKQFISESGGIFTEKYFSLQREEVTKEEGKRRFAREARDEYYALNPVPRTRQSERDARHYAESKIQQAFPTQYGGARTLANLIDSPAILTTIKLREIGRIKTSMLTRAKLGKKGQDGERAGWLALPDVSKEIMRTPRVPLWARRKALTCLYGHHSNELARLRKAGIHPFLPKWVGGLGCVPNGTRRLTDLTLKERKRVAVLAATRNADGTATDPIALLIRKYRYGWSVLDRTKSSAKAHEIAKSLVSELKEAGDPGHGGYPAFNAYTELKVKITALQARDPREVRTPGFKTVTPETLGRKFSKINKAALKLRPYINPMSLAKINLLGDDPPANAERYILNSTREALLKDIERAFTFRKDGENQVPKWVTTLLSKRGNWEQDMREAYPRFLAPTT
jgi:hypothetical protein